jgi:hypothetical protein
MTTRRGASLHLKEGEMSALEMAVALAAGIVASIVGGAAGGMLVGAKSLGIELAGLLGVFYGLVGGTLGVLIGLGA